jgi:membrane-associated phospholipid phosphatase
MLFDYIGYYGPLILTAISGFSLMNRFHYFVSFTIGTIANACLNGILKDVFREPRPSRQIPFNGEKPSGIHVYGFPSGHAQITAFATAFLYLAKGPPATVYLMTFIFFLTLYQRWKYRLHSVKQLVFGTLFGVGFAWTTFYFTKKGLR